MTEIRTIRFVSSLLSGQTALLLGNGEYRATRNNKFISLDQIGVERLVSDGVLLLGSDTCQASPLARNWVKRQLLSQDSFAEQHRLQATFEGETKRNLFEGPISRLSIKQKGAAPFLDTYHVQAAQKIQSLAQLSQMIQRTTMSYDPTRSSSTANSGVAGLEMSDRAMDARTALNTCLTAMPRDCAGVVLDVCGLQKGLQLVETERQWPRRSAKLILRVGLEQAAAHFGLDSYAVGSQTNKPKYWMAEGSRASLF